MVVHYNAAVCSNDTDGMVNSLDPDQTASLEEI